MPKEFSSIQKQVEQYLRKTPSVQSALFSGIVNYSKLSRKIKDDLNKPGLTIDSLIIACRRIYAKQTKSDSKSSAQISKILESTSIQVRNKISVINFDVKMPSTRLNSLRELSKNKLDAHDVVYFIEGRSSITMIVSNSYLKDIQSRFGKYILKTYSNLVELILKSSTKLEEVPGVVAHIYSLLADSNINVVETISCWTDTILIIDKKDLQLAMEVLDFS